MRQISFANKTNSKPRLEIRALETGDIRRVEVETSPFTIGRAETADFQIDSAQVSREHAQLCERNGVWFIRDLGSTNGSRVNGKEVIEALLNDGDILTIAETDVTFIASTASQFQRMVTQPIQSRQRPAAPTSLPPEVVASRTVTEQALWQAFHVELQQAASLTGGRAEAIFATAWTDTQLQGGQPGTRPPAADSCRALHRIRSIEQAAALPGVERVFVPFDAVEIETPSRALANLEPMQDLLPSGVELGITLSLHTILDTLRLEEVCRDAHVQGLLVALCDFQGNGAQVLHLDALEPIYLLLSDSMTKDLVTSRQPLRRLESVFTACQQLSVKPVLPRINNDHTLLQCQQLGYDLALRPLTSRSQSAPAAARITT